ncbi:putative peptide N-acetyl-beta-D-glucosaminyl asparaginase amidase A [Lyophyllum shimeji]|uniref:Peptide N-acetyl-beta-D-glucosaminyl asparaginase amidase A n=1 Tax=Lyophyllum shimeji TaxID=47721 RepID=A0A9P3PFB5_LYOSH|nr:putative peptide N-acetyl-beta-D-glucosaminyl asparaginase amidase A [Lyophyllum shimeji]
MLVALLLFCVVRLALGTVLVDFQVAQPPPVPQDARQCTFQILQRDFAFSFGSSEVAQFTPPSDCGPIGSWAAITLNFTVTSNGTQFDRLGIFTFQNVEIWRTSTPEPTRGDGIIWTYIKDVTRYTPLFAKPGTFILQLDNLIQPGLDGIYSTTLHATFYASSSKRPPAKKADLIVPLSTFANNTGNDASVPPGFSLNVTLPRNTVSVFAELYASGNGAEEFWYFNAANQFLPRLPSGTALGQGPFREVRLLIDDKIAGVAFPYATIFTGGIAPTAWRPISSYGALDLPTYFLDLSPFVPVLVDGRPHEFTIDVASAEDDHAILQNWFVSGLLQVNTDVSPKPTTGRITSYAAQPFASTATTGSVDDSGDVNITVKATRRIHVEADIVSGSGKRTHAIWSQDLRYSNVQNYLKNTTIQNVVQAASGTVLSLHNGVPSVVDTFSYPLNINITLLTPNGGSFVASFDHSYDRDLLPFPAVSRSTTEERQLAVGFFNVAPTGNTGNGTNSNVFCYSDSAGNTYRRRVNAVLNNITLDVQSGTLAPDAQRDSMGSPPAVVGPTRARLPGGRVIGL